VQWHVRSWCFTILGIGKVCSHLTYLHTEWALQRLGFMSTNIAALMYILSSRKTNHMANISTFWPARECGSSSGDHQWVILTLLTLLASELCFNIQFSSVQSLSRVWLFATPWIAARQASLSITNSRSSLRLTSIESVMPSSHLILCRPLLLLPLIPPSIRVFSNESTLCMRWPKYWSWWWTGRPGVLRFMGSQRVRHDWVTELNWTEY